MSLQCTSTNVETAQKLPIHTQFGHVYVNRATLHMNGSIIIILLLAEILSSIARISYWTARAFRALQAVMVELVTRASNDHIKSLWF